MGRAPQFPLWQKAGVWRGGMAGRCAAFTARCTRNAHFFSRCRRPWGRRALRSGSFTAEPGDQTRLEPLPRRHWHRIVLLPSLRCPRAMFQLPRCPLHARVLLMPPRQPGPNGLMIQVLARQRGESPKPRVGIATYPRRHFRFARGRMRIAPGETGWRIRLTLSFIAVMP